MFLTTKEHGQFVRFGALCIFVFANVVLVGAPLRAEDQPSVTTSAEQSKERVPLSTVVPLYPADAIRDRIEGDVQVCFDVDRGGRTYRIAVRRSSSRVFEQPAMRAIRASTYQPLPADAKLVGIKTCRTFRFRLEVVKPPD